MFEPQYQFLEEENQDPEQPRPADQPALEDFFAPPPSPEPEWGRVFSLLSEPRQIGLGEGLATEAWLSPDDKLSAPALPDAPAPAQSDPYRWSGLKPGLLARLAKTVAAQQMRAETMARAFGQEGMQIINRDKPTIRYDARNYNYLNQMAAARMRATNALVDPYTDMIATFKMEESVTSVVQEIAWERQRIHSYTNAAYANQQLGKLSISHWHLRGAESAFERAIRADAHDAESWWALGIVKLLRRKNKQAVKALRNACDYRPGDARSRIALGIAQYHSQDYAGAEETLNYEKGSDGIRVGARSFLACACRMQGKWDTARMEIHALAQNSVPAWKEMAAQCARCIDRGEEGTPAAKPRSSFKKQAKYLAGAGFALFAIWGEFEKATEQIRHGNIILIALSVFILLVMVIGLFGELKPNMKENITKGPFGDGREDLPCWQTRSWMRPHKLDLFGQPMDIPRK
jgi:Flp pilus assembly protein TadD